MSLNQEEEEYIERLYREMYTRLCIYAMSALGSKALAEEVVQDTFRIACIKPDGLMSSKNPRGWLINTLKNVIRNRRRTEARLSNALLAAMSAYEPQARRFSASCKYRCSSIYYVGSCGRIGNYG